MLKTLRFKFGASSGLPRLRCNPGVVTLFVGPNNAGKSRILNEIAEAIGLERFKRKGYLEPETASERFILRDLKVSLPSDTTLRAEFINEVSNDLKDLCMKSKGTRNAMKQWGELGPLVGLLGMSAQATTLFSQGKLNIQVEKSEKAADATPPDKTVEPTPQAEPVSAALDELIEHAQKNRLRKLARKWISKKIVNLTGYVKLLAPYTIVLDGTTRLSLVEDSGAANWRRRDDNRLANLVKDVTRVATLRSIVHGALNYYPVIDTTHPTSTQLKLSKEHPQAKERSREPEALEYFDKATPISAFSDGIKSFVGILSAVLSGDHKIILIDEPEAFLHPPLARKLGVELHTLARQQHAQVFAATHSPDFLMGCIQSGADVNIVRLTYKDGQATARELKPERVSLLMRNPLLRSTGVLGALFHSGAVVCESDSDRAFYQEINERLLICGRGAEGVAFLNAQNKQTIDRIIGPLREMGVPAAAVLDLDVLSTGEELSRLLMAAGVEPVIRESLTALRDRFFRCCVESSNGDPTTAKKRLKREGLNVLSAKERSHFQLVLLTPLAQVGIFVVPEGELESWLSPLTQDIGRSDKAKWLVKVFEKLGDDPSQPEYILPESQGVWAFLEAIGNWISTPQRTAPS